MARWVVRPGHTVIVDAMNPRIMADVTNEPRLRDVADDVAVELQTAIDSLGRKDSAPTE